MGGAGLVCLLLACTTGSDRDRRELRALEAAMGLVANANPEDRGVRLDQLEKLSVESEKIDALKQKCVSAYRSFQRASETLVRARMETGHVADRIAEFKENQAVGATLTEEEGEALRRDQAKAMETVQKVTRALDLAEGYVATCEKRLQTIKGELGLE